MASFYDNSNSARGAVALRPSDYVNVQVLAANVVEKHTIPADHTYVSFQSTGDFWCKFGDTNVVASIPSGDVANGSASELSPSVRRIDGFTHISLISSAATTVVMSFYKA